MSVNLYIFNFYNMVFRNFSAILLFACFVSGLSYEIRTNNSFKGFENVVNHFKSQRLLSSQPDVTVIRGFLNDLSSLSPETTFGFKDAKISKNGKMFSGNCSNDLMYVLRHLKSKWAEEMIDANGKLPSGILRGNFLWMGNFQECSEIEVATAPNESYHNFHGEYCIAQWNIDFLAESVVVPLKTAVCMPDSCNGTVLQSDIQSLLYYLDYIPFVKKYSSVLSLKAVTCKKPYENFDNLAISFLVVIACFGVLIITGSAITTFAYFFPRRPTRPTYSEFLHSQRRESSSSSEHEPMPNESEYYIDEEEDETIFQDGRPNYESMSQRVLSVSKVFSGYIFKIKHFFLCFCVFTNGRKILTTEVAQNQLLCIHGVRVLSMVWIILGHTYIHCLPVIENAADITKSLDNFSFQVILHGTFSVDSFFLISGFLLVYLFLKEVEKPSSRINWPFLMIHRFWRLTPVYAMVIFFGTAIFKYTGSGGFWEDVDQYQNCEKYWWWNLLYINNFLSINSMCMAWTWYLANDMQFFIITMCLLYVIWRWPKIGLSIIAILLIISWTVTLYISHVNEIVPFFSDFDDVKNATEYTQRLYHNMDLAYSKPYCRVGPYFVGVFLAYIYYKTGARTRFLLWWQQMLGWILAIFCSLSVIYGLYHVKTENQILFDFYNAFSRTSFSLGVAWLIYMCLTGHAFIINQVLSYQLWIPFSRLTYCTYLIHPVIMSWYFQNLRQPLYFTNQTVLKDYSGRAAPGPTVFRGIQTNGIKPRTTNILKTGKGRSLKLNVLCFFAFLLMSYGIGFFMSLAFEAPMMKWEKLIRQKFTKD